MSSELEDTWVIESYVGNIGWSLSRLNDSPDTHPLDWCLEQWRAFRRGDLDDQPFGPERFADPHLYRLRNVRTSDIIMCAVL